jgi:hypothetical protein
VFTKHVNTHSETFEDFMCICYELSNATAGDLDAMLITFLTSKGTFIVAYDSQPPPPSII